jgi:hypothetical protein
MQKDLLWLSNKENELWKQSVALQAQKVVKWVVAGFFYHYQKKKVVQIEKYTR